METGTDVNGVNAAAGVAAGLEGRLLACAESCTAGRVSGALAGVGGASEWLRGSLVAYQAEMKRSLLGVTAPSVLSERAAAEMATGAIRLFGAEVAVEFRHPAGSTTTFLDAGTSPRRVLRDERPSSTTTATVTPSTTPAPSEPRSPRA
jgi:nicotinamide mononucleotide (NMN) deamidase PncC